MIKIYRGSYVIRQIKSLHCYTLLSGIGKAGLTNEDSRSIINRDSSKNRYFIQMGIAEIDLCGVDRCAKPRGKCWLAE